jgi:hypothetical protein
MGDSLIEQDLNLEKTKKDSNFFENEFKRIYSELYPDEASLSLAIEHYKKSYPYMQLSRVSEKLEERVDYLKYFLKPLEERRKLGWPENGSAGFLFSDIKEVIKETKLDVVYLSNSCRPIYLGDDSKVNIGKCVCAIKRNKIDIGNFSRVLWNNGMDYLNAVIDKLIEPADNNFTISLKEPTYTRPILVISDYCDEGRMLGEYIGFLNDKKGIGKYSQREPKIFGFSFIGTNCYSADGGGYILDSLHTF